MIPTNNDVESKKNTNMPMTDCDDVTPQPTTIETRRDPQQASNHKQIDDELFCADLQRHQTNHYQRIHKKPVRYDGNHRQKGDIRRARIARSVRFSYENIVHRYCPEYHGNPAHKSQIGKFAHRHNPILTDITTMTNNTALTQLELAEARKRKADEQGKGTPKTPTTKKSSLRRRNANSATTSNTSDVTMQSSTQSVDLTNATTEDGTHRTNKVFYTIKLYSNGGNEPLKVLQQTLREWFRTMQSCVGSIVLYDSTPNGTLVLTKPEQISTNLQALKKFFNGIRPRSGAGDIWFTTLLGYNEDDEELVDNTRWWYQEKKSVMYRKPLQVLDTSRELWLLYSHEKMNLSSLQEAMNAEIARKNYPSVPFALTHSNIRDGSKFNTKKKDDKPIKAIHVEVATVDIDRIKTLFSQLYGSRTTTFPLQMKMRYVLAIKNSTDSKTKNQILALRNKQDWFLGSVTHAQTWEIAELDKVTSTNTKTLRTLLMDIKIKDTKSTLFLGVNNDRRGDGVFFTFPTASETEARDMISYFGTYLAHVHTVEVLKYLKHDAAKRSKEATWDSDKHEAVTEENKTLDILMGETDGIDWLQDPNRPREVQLLQDPEQMEKDRRDAQEAFLFSQDNGSVKTFNPDHFNRNRNDTNGGQTTDDSRNDMSVVSGISKGGSVSTKATEVIAAYHGMKQMMIGLERMIKDQAQANNNSDVDRTPSFSASPLSLSGAAGQPST